MPTDTAPRVTAGHALAVLASPSAVAVLDLPTGRVTLVPRPGDDVWESPTAVVLITHEDAVAAAAVAAAGSPRNFRAALVEALNADLAVLHAAGEIPTLEELTDVLAELSHIDADVIDLAARRSA